MKKCGKADRLCSFFFLATTKTDFVFYQSQKWAKANILDQQFSKYELGSPGGVWRVKTIFKIILRCYFSSLYSPLVNIQRNFSQTP